MYPVLKSKYMLLKQYGESVIYPLLSNIEGQKASSKYSYEKINRTASEILELCDGSNSINDIVGILSEKYTESIEKATSFVSSFIDQSINLGFVDLLHAPNITTINVSGNYETVFPFNVQFELTKECPLKCSHCFNSSGEKRSDELTTKEVKAVFDKLEAMGVKKIMLTGGEPTVRNDFIEIVAYASTKFIGISVASNGYCITEKMAYELSKYKNVVVQISIDGTEDHHNIIRGMNNSFERATNAVKMLAANGVSVIVATTFNNINFDDAEFVTILAKALGAKQITFSITFNIGRAKANNLTQNMNIGELMRKCLLLSGKYSDDTFYVNAKDTSQEGLKKKISTCGRGNTQMCVRENGDISPCLQFNLVYGNLKNQDIYDLFNHARISCMIGFNEPSLDTCFDCERAYDCNGCVAMAYNMPIEVCKWKKNNPDIIERFQKITIIK
jgi:radical SAM protein with 4Fe4S-binding SPASM domain